MAASARVERGWADLLSRREDDLRRAFRRLADSPLERYPGRQFPLRDLRFKGAWEYEVAAGDRVFYRVNREEAIVTVLYAGPHAAPGKVI